MRIVSVATLCLALSGLASAVPTFNSGTPRAVHIRQEEEGNLETATVSRTVTVTEGSHTEIVYATITETVNLVDPLLGFQLAIATVTDARFAAVRPRGGFARRARQEEDSHVIQSQPAPSSTSSHGSAETPLLPSPDVYQRQEPAPSTTTIEVIETVTAPANTGSTTTITQTVFVTRTSAPGATTTTTTTVFVGPPSATPSNSDEGQSTASSAPEESDAPSASDSSETSDASASETAPSSDSSSTPSSTSTSDSSSTMAPSSPSPRLSTDELAGLVAGLFVFVIVASVIAIMFWHRFRHPVDQEPAPPRPAPLSITPPPLPADDPGILGSPAVTGPGLPGWPTASQIRIPVRPYPHPKRRTQSSELSPFGYLPTVNERAPTPMFRASMMDLPEEEPSTQAQARRRSVGDIGMAVPMSPPARAASRFSTMRV
ncbi:hypothetical protein ACHAQA_009405 [Verticillium albo-atrum]